MPYEEMQPCAEFPQCKWTVDRCVLHDLVGVGRRILHEGVVERWGRGSGEGQGERGSCRGGEGAGEVEGCA